MNRRRFQWKGPVVVALCALGLAGCEGRLARLSDADLQDRMYQCNVTLEQSPGFAISCDNYRRECQRRRDQGRFVC